jgi:hypothetical protein
VICFYREDQQEKVIKTIAEVNRDLQVKGEEKNGLNVDKERVGQDNMITKRHIEDMDRVM